MAVNNSLPILHNDYGNVKNILQKNYMSSIKFFLVPHLHKSLHVYVVTKMTYFPYPISQKISTKRNSMVPMNMTSSLPCFLVPCCDFLIDGRSYYYENWVSLNTLNWHILYHYNVVLLKNKNEVDDTQASSNLLLDKVPQTHFFVS